MNIPLLDTPRQFLDFLYERIRKSYCDDFFDNGCAICPFYREIHCSELSHKQMDSIINEEFHKTIIEAHNNDGGAEK